MNLPADWLSRLRAALRAAPEHDPARWHIAGRPISGMQHARAFVPAEPQAAAVLVPIIDRPDVPSLLLTTRAGHLRLLF